MRPAEAPFSVLPDFSATTGLESGVLRMESMRRLPSFARLDIHKDGLGVRSSLK
jgi:hypothetical protein